MLKGSSESEISDGEDGQWSGGEGPSSGRVPVRPVLRAPTLRVPTSGDLEGVQRELSEQEARLRALTEEANRAEAQARAMVDNLELAKLQAATCLDLRKDIHSIEKFNGDEGELNHFLRSGDGLHQRISERLRTGRLDELDAASLRSALVRRVHRGILNMMQADETTSWEDLRARLQRCYGGGRWTPDEDALRLLRLTRGRHTKGEFAAQVLRQYTAVVDRYREVLPAGEAAAKIGLLESLVQVQLGEATGETVTRPVVEEANRLIDAAEREETVRQPREWRAQRPEPPRPELRRRPPPYRDERRRREDPRDRRAHQARPAPRPREEPRCYKCGKRGHLQAKCPLTRCYECQSAGHLARNCPYMRGPRPSRGEPMEVNLQRPATTRGGRKPEGTPPSSCGSGREETEGEDLETESEDDRRSYATVVRRGGRRGGRAVPGALVRE